MPHKPKIAIIGLGFLMTYLKPCYHRLLGEELAPYMIAATHSQDTVRQKQQIMGFPVVCQGYLEMLKSHQPDLLLFSPVPKSAVHIMEQYIAPYYCWLREQSLPLPDFYAFPPTPSVDYYAAQLGADVNAVRILPNMAAELAGHDISQEGLSLFTFPGGKEWLSESYDRLMNFFRPVGDTIVVPQTHSNTILGCYVCGHIVQETAYTIASALSAKERPLSLADAAGAMRARLLDVSGRHFLNALPCNLQDAASAAPLLSAVLEHFIAGMRRFNQVKSVPALLGDAVMASQLDIFLQSAQLLDYSEIQANNQKHATKGGLLEIALQSFYELMETKLFELSSECCTGQSFEPLCRFVEDSIFEICGRIVTRGAQLAV